VRGVLYRVPQSLYNSRLRGGRSFLPRSSLDAHPSFQRFIRHYSWRVEPGWNPYRPSPPNLVPKSGHTQNSVSLVPPSRAQSFSLHKVVHDESVCCDASWGRGVPCKGAMQVVTQGQCFFN
jgi:hypothetical protein